MNGFLLDTNVVSEYTRRHPNSAVVDFIVARSDLWLSVVVIHEMEYGVAIIKDIPYRISLNASTAEFVDYFRDRILPVSRQGAELAASLRAQAHRDSRVLQPADALIAGTALAHDLTLATRNTKDFIDLDVDIFNPWDDSP